MRERRNKAGGEREGERKRERERESGSTKGRARIERKERREIGGRETGRK